MEVLAQAGGSRKDLEAVHVTQVQRLFGSQCGRSLCLPHGLRARRDYTGISVYSSIYKEGTAHGQEAALPEYAVSKDERRRLEAGEALTFLLGNGQKLQAKLIFLENNGMDFKIFRKISIRNGLIMIK